MKCPHQKPKAIVAIQVCKLGAWDGAGPWALHIDVLGGGAYQVAEGTKAEMQKLDRLCQQALKGNCGPAKFVLSLLRQMVPEAGEDWKPK